jgi:hypothetical protein
MYNHFASIPKPYFFSYWPPELDYTVADKIVGMKSIAAYRSGLEIDPYVSEIKAEEGLLQELNGIQYALWCCSNYA